MEVGMVSNSYYAAVKNYMKKEEKQTGFAEKIAEKDPSRSPFHHPADPCMFSSSLYYI